MTADLDLFRVEFNSFGRICDSISVGFSFDISLKSGGKGVAVSNAQRPWCEQDVSMGHTWALLVKNVGSWSLIPMALVYSPIAPRKSPAAKALFPWFLKSIA